MIVGITGLIGCGKTTAATHLVNWHGYWRRRFADPLKSMLKTLGLTDEQLDGKLKETPDPFLGGNTPRLAMQMLGTEWGRALNHDLWVEAWKRDIQRTSNQKIVADDVRFDNEAQIIRSMGGIIVNIDRPGVKQGTHASEVQEIEADVYISNNGTVEELREMFDDIETWF